MDNKQLQKEMVTIIKSDEAKKAFEESLRNLDPNALTPEGVIQSYEIDYDSIKHNPMGGINVTLIINNDEALNIENILNKFNKDTLEVGSSTYSVKLDTKLKEKYGNEQ